LNLSVLFFIGKLHMYLVGLESMMSPFTTFLWGKMRHLN